MTRLTYLVKFLIISIFVFQNSKDEDKVTSQIGEGVSIDTEEVWTKTDK